MTAKGGCGFTEGRGSNKGDTGATQGNEVVRERVTTVNSGNIPLSLSRQRGNIAVTLAAYNVKSVGHLRLVLGKEISTLETGNIRFGQLFRLLPNNRTCWTSVIQLWLLLRQEYSHGVHVIICLPSQSHNLILLPQTRGDFKRSATQIQVKGRLLADFFCPSGEPPLVF
jgi:hypothetical protein